MTSRDARNDAPDELHTPTQIVCVYAQSDQQWYDDLKTYLVHWERAKKIIWLDIQAGADTTQTMEKHLKRADLILLLLSPTFFAVDSCSTVMPLVLHEKEQRQAPVVPIIVRACDWKDLTCGGRKALPDYDSFLPLAHWKHPEQIRAGLARLVPGLDPDGQSIRPQLFQAHDLPKGYMPRPKAVGEIKHLLLNHQGNQPTAVTTALRGVGGFVSSCAVSPDGRFIVSASNDETLKVWDVATGIERLTLTGHTDPIFGCAVSPDGRFIVSASNDETLKVWDVATGVERLTLTGHTLDVVGCAISPDSRFIVSASYDETLKVWDAATGAELLVLCGHTSLVNGCAVSPDGRFIVSASDDRTLKVWDVATGIERLTLSGHTSHVWGCAVSPDGRFIVSASDDRTLKVWDVATGIERLTLSGHTGFVHNCAVSPDGCFIVSASDDRTLKVWNAQTGLCLLTFLGEGALFGCTFHPDGEHLVACGTPGVYVLRLVM